MSYTYINDDVIEKIKDDFAKYTINSNYQEENSNGEYQVVFKTKIQTKNNKSINISFKKYLPTSLSPLTSIFAFMFHSMPKMYEPLLYELLAKISDNTKKYEYKKEYYEQNKIIFLEKIVNRYFAVVEGTEK